MSTSSSMYVGGSKLIKQHYSEGFDDAGWSTTLENSMGMNVVDALEVGRLTAILACARIPLTEAQQRRVYEAVN